MLEVKAYQPGSVVKISGEMWAVQEVRIILRESDKPLRSHEMVQILRLLAVDDNGEDLGKDPIDVNIDMYDIVEI